ncbi:MAG: DUF465 domain-containing protein [Desulfuromonadales bacterium GWD2_61_12]|nr:MAG: DUF465 domain-containing protein [Desulfuromonadales bacterium GWC2_61_20]OGR36365.1 MAG: DUF465 domain-containing protein [Desulfuromonadales bacterium GWD2_61_12]HAD03372.1 DUF465 domain-containing protein [Desulfuromonas sp.]HBT82920.1 DUF465 domain-containing protein [Desulfuromonas sp.]
MEESDKATIQRLADQNPRFRLLYEEHLLLEKELKQYNDKTFLSPAEELEKKKIQKMKLAGKDEMDQILRARRQ